MAYSTFAVEYNPAEVPATQQPPKSSPVKILAIVTLLALLIIGSVGAAGVFPGTTTIGWVTLGLASALSLFSIALFKSDKANAVTILSGVALIIIGALGGTGILSPTQVGWGLVGTCITHLVVRSTCAAWISQKQRQGSFRY
jgi:hypothetical protein